MQLLKDGPHLNRVALLQDERDPTGEVQQCAGLELSRLDLGFDGCWRYPPCFQLLPALPERFTGRCRPEHWQRPSPRRKVCC